MRETSDTRGRIQEIALKLFTEKGYEATSLREIAEALGVTKAALYYHFKTKDDIVASLAEDRRASIERLIAWGQGQPRTLETRLEFVRRYADELYDSHHHVFMRCMERTQTALRDHPQIEKPREMMTRLVGVLWDDDASSAQRLKSSMAIFTLHAAWFVLKEEVGDDERMKAALEVALELIEPTPPGR